MTETIVMTVNNVERCSGRFIGVIDEEECRAVLNTKDAAKRVYTSESEPLNNQLNTTYEKRFVIATKDRTIFISPQIRFLQRFANKLNFSCEDGKDYTLRKK